MTRQQAINATRFRVMADLRWRWRGSAGAEAYSTLTFPRPQRLAEPPRFAEASNTPESLLVVELAVELVLPKEGHQAGARFTEGHHQRPPSPDVARTHPIIADGRCQFDRSVLTWRLPAFVIE